MKQFYIILCVVLSPQFMLAQFAVGFAAGVTNNLVQSNYDGINNSSHFSLKGISAKLQSGYAFSNWMALQVDFEYLQKNYKIKRSGFYEGVYTDKRNSYLQIPLTARLSIGEKKLSGFVNLGVYGGYWISGREKGVNANILAPLSVDQSNFNPLFLSTFKASHFNEKYHFDDDKDNRIEFGYLAGGGLQYATNSVATVFVQARYYYSVANQQKETKYLPSRLYNETLDISAGVIFPFSKSAKH